MDSGYKVISFKEQEVRLAMNHGQGWKFLVHNLENISYYLCLFSVLNII